MTNNINIEIKDGKVNAALTSPATLPEILQILSTVALQFMNHSVTQFGNTPRQEGSPTLEEIKENIYDMYNYAASRTLEIFAPEIEMRPDLTVEAILEKENEIIKEA